MVYVQKTKDISVVTTAESLPWMVGCAGIA